MTRSHCRCYPVGLDSRLEQCWNDVLGEYTSRTGIDVKGSGFMRTDSADATLVKLRAHWSSMKVQVEDRNKVKARLTPILALVDTVRTMVPTEQEAVR